MKVTERYPRETGRDYALRIIKDNIIRLELPPGALISENELAAELGLSRTPVREALIELSKVSVIEIQPQKKSVVALIDYDLIEDHERIVDAIAAGDKQAASAIMEKHLSRYKIDAAAIREKYPQYFHN